MIRKQESSLQITWKCLPIYNIKFILHDIVDWIFMDFQNWFHCTSANQHWFPFLLSGMQCRPYCGMFSQHLFIFRPLCPQTLHCLNMYPIYYDSPRPILYKVALCLSLLCSFYRILFLLEKQLSKDSSVNPEFSSEQPPEFSRFFIAQWRSTKKNLG